MIETLKTQEDMTSDVELKKLKEGIKSQNDYDSNQESKEAEATNPESVVQEATIIANRLVRYSKEAKEKLGSKAPDKFTFYLDGKNVSVSSKEVAKLGDITNWRNDD